MDDFISLNGSWRLECDDGRDFASEVPGDVILDLMRAGAIRDPNLRNNFRECRWIGEHVWSFKRTFSATVVPGFRYTLIFEGLAYVAEIFLNGVAAGRHKTMHRPCRVDVSDLIREGENRLEVRLRAFDLAEKETPLLDFDLTGWSDAIRDRELCRKRGAGRKADYTNGWDWTQGLPVCGIWRGCGLEINSFLRIRDPFIRTENTGAVHCSFTLESVLKDVADGVLRVTVRQSGRTVAWNESEVVLAPGFWEYERSMQIDGPELWYPRGYGEQPLYEAELSISCGERSVRRTVRFAFRQVSLEWENRNSRQEVFRFGINGQSVFAKGANWIPADIIPGRVTPTHLRRLLELAAECDMNYLRIWGGGCYEQDLFYDLCDELGIMVWQDFMFGGSEVPDFEPKFRAECRIECKTVLKRLRNHPCIIMWCGSNETDSFYEGSLAKKRPQHYCGWRLFHVDFPELVHKFAPAAHYLPSCPTPGLNGGNPNSPGMGTYHGNFASHQYASDAEFDAEKAVPAFDNELYGVSGDPESDWKRYLADGDLDRWDNPVFQNHQVLDLQRNDEWNLFFKYLTFDAVERRLDLPLRQILDYFAHAHCELVKRYMEVLRRKPDLCGGAAFWMYNNAYPMMGWALVDYYGTPKAVYYAMKRACRDLLPIIAVYEKQVDVHVSFTGKKWRGALTASCVRFTGEVVFRRRIEAQADSSTRLLSIDRTEFGNAAPEECFLLAELETAGRETVRNHRFLASPRSLRLPEARISLQVDPASRNAFLLKSDRFAAGVTLAPWSAECYPDDNAFDLYPGIPKKVRFSAPTGMPELRWLNSPERQPYVCGLAGEAGNRRITVYNPSARARRLKVELQAGNCRYAGPSAIQVNAESTASFDVRFSPELLHGYPFCFPVDLQIGGNTLHSACFKFFPSCMDRGVLRIDNISAIPLEYPAAVYRGYRHDGSLFERECGPLFAAPGERMEFDFAPPPDLTPFRSGLYRNGRLLFRFWDDLVPFERIRMLMRAESDTGTNLAAFPFAREEPDPVREGAGVLFQAGSSGAPRLIPERKIQGEILIFLFRRGRMLYLDVFTAGFAFGQRYSEENVWRDSCVELLLGYPDNSVYRDYSLAQTIHGPQIFLRRGSGEIAPGLRSAGSRLEVFHSPSEPVQLYRLCLDTAEEGMPDLLTADEFRIGMIVRTPQGNGIRLFNGIGYGGKGCVDAAAVRNAPDISPTDFIYKTEQPSRSSTMKIVQPQAPDAIKINRNEREA